MLDEFSPELSRLMEPDFSSDESATYKSYLVRVMLRRGSDGVKLVTAEVHAIQSGETSRFESLSATLAFLEVQLGTVGEFDQ